MKKKIIGSKPSVGLSAKYSGLFLTVCLAVSSVSISYADTVVIPTPTRGANAGYSLKEISGGSGANTTAPVNSYTINRETGSATSKTMYIDVSKKTYSDGTVVYTFNESNKNFTSEYNKNENPDPSINTYVQGNLLEETITADDAPQNSVFSNSGKLGNEHPVSGKTIYTENHIKSTLQLNEIKEDQEQKSATLKGGIFNNNGELDTLNADFVGNKTEVGAFQPATEDRTQYVSVRTSANILHNEGDIGSVIGDYIQNSSYRPLSDDVVIPDGYSSDALYSYATADTTIYNLNNIDSIEGNFISNQSGNAGGAILNDAYNDNNGRIGSITGNFIANYASTAGGAIANHEGKIGSIEADFIGNNASGMLGGGAIINGTGIVFYDISSDATIDSIKGDFLYNRAGTTWGGAIANIGHIGTIESNFINNYAQNGGGAIANGIQGSIDVLNTNFIDNSTDTSGGAIWNLGTIGAGTEEQLNPAINGLFIGNTAIQKGGAIFNDGGKIYGINGSFYNNKAVDSTATEEDIPTNVNGGAIYNSGYIATVGGNPAIEADFIQNTANSRGGAIFNSGNIDSIKGNFKANSAYFSDAQTSVSHGGGIYNSGTIGYNGINKVAISGDFDSNDAKTNGGGIYNSGKIYGIEGSFNANVSDVNGGGIYNGTEATIDSIKGKFESNLSVNGGGIYNSGYITGNETTPAIEADFINNDAWNGDGGGIYNDTSGRIGAIKGDFTGNNATPKLENINKGDGAAIYNKGIINSLNGDFTNNSAYKSGGAIYNTGDIGKVNSETAAITGDFSSNTSKVSGGSIYNDSTGNIYGIIGNFSNNKVTGDLESEIRIDDGGAIDNNGYISYINGTFNQNSAYDDGGAIINLKTIDYIEGEFTGNTAGDKGGAIYNFVDAVIGSADSDTPAIKGYFNENKSTDGGAIYNNNGYIYGIEGNFSKNQADKQGGGIYNANNEISMIKGDFDNNQAEKGSAIYNNKGTVTISGNFYDNIATDENSGAIHNEGGIVNLLATDSDKYFRGNKAGNDKVGIYDQASDDGTKPVVNINTANGKSVIFDDKIKGDTSLQEQLGKNYNTININDPVVNPLAHTGATVFNDAVTNHTIILNDGTMKLGKDGNIDGDTLIINGGTIDMINGKTGTAKLDTLTINNDAKLNIDIDFKKQKADKLTADNYGDLNGDLYVTDLNILSDPKDGRVSISLADDELKEHIILDTVTLDKSVSSPIATYKAQYDSSSGLLGLRRTGFTPAILASPVAAQLGGYLNQLNSYEQAFGNLDLRMNYDRKTRNAFKYANKYAYSGNTQVFSPTYLQEQNAGVWLRPYITYESVGLKNGPKVDNALYGSYFGGDSPIYSFSNGVDMQYSVYAGYTGSHQSYTDTGIYQNGGILGATALLYKDNFFTALTLNAGASAGNASTKYGDENFVMFSTGVANKTGYNWELADGKFIIQPSILLSYSFVNTFNYTNAAGVRVTSDPIHAINVSPGLKFIGNFGNGWQPYIGARMVWNILDKADYFANDVALPSLSVKPYVQYGLGIQKLWGERSTGFAQFMIRNGGRNGFAFNIGYRYALGR